VVQMNRWHRPFGERDPRIPPRAIASRVLIPLLVGVGILLRIAQYLANRSIWHDEALLALNFFDLPLTDLVKPLEFGQAAPIGFLLTEEVVARFFGFSEYALRLFPLICGLVAIPLFVWLARRILSSLAVPVAILLFVVADGLIYYASEVKPYETDVAAAVGLLAAGVLITDDTRRLSRTTTLVIGFCGIALIALSFPAVLILASVAAAFAASLAANWSRTRLRAPESVVLVSWGLTSIGITIFGLTRGRSIREAFEHGSGRFLGVSGSSSPLHTVNTLGTNIAQAIGFSQDAPYTQIMKLALVCAVVGAAILLRRNWVHLTMLVLPIVFLLAASAAHAYPISERTTLFLVPSIILLIAEGIGQLVLWVPSRARVLAAITLVALVAGGPVLLAAKRLVHPRTHEEIKPVLRFVRDHWRPGDALYVHWGAQYALLYYDECECLRLSAQGGHTPLWPLKPARSATEKGQAALPESPNVMLGRYLGNNAGPYIQDLNRVRDHRRVWFLYTHLISTREQALVENTLLRRLSSFGERINGIDRTGAHAYLYRIRHWG
jgi:hypothetical protein